MEISGDLCKSHFNRGVKIQIFVGLGSQEVSKIAHQSHRPITVKERSEIRQFLDEMS